MVSILQNKYCQFGGIITVGWKKTTFLGESPSLLDQPCGHDPQGAMTATDKEHDAVMLWRPLKTLEKGQCQWRGPAHEMLNFMAIQLQVASCICTLEVKCTDNFQNVVYTVWSCSITCLWWDPQKMLKWSIFGHVKPPKGILQQSVPPFVGFSWPVSLSTTWTFGKHPSGLCLVGGLATPKTWASSKKHPRNVWVWDRGMAEYLCDYPSVYTLYQLLLHHGARSLWFGDIPL